MSRRLALLNVLLRWGVRPKLARTWSPEAGAAEFQRSARWIFRVPPLTCALSDMAESVPVLRVTTGPVPVRQVILFLHGGAYFAGSAQTHLGLMARLSRLAGVTVIGADYRLLQDAPFPAAFEDAVTVWDVLRSRGYPAEGIVIGGDSAGGGLALALLAHVLEREEQPAGVFVMSPWTDLTMSGSSIHRFAQEEAILPVERMAEGAARYLSGGDPRDGRASPLFATFRDPPPVLIQVGSTEVLHDDAVRMAEVLRAAGGTVDLRVWDHCPHVWQIFDGWLPEARAALREVARFVQISLERASR